jgi:hypothetical protein
VNVTLEEEPRLAHVADFVSEAEGERPAKG